MITICDYQIRFPLIQHGSLIRSVAEEISRCGDVGVVVIGGFLVDGIGEEIFFM